ncbi:phenylalanine--tRNA ligase subunit alpha [Candidatus Gottesmanbacteria bacterium]|nr:phenylalanine--tRNA ligase subunit alpha [Candidatus Gottesmanbacteria bacterium]
MTLREELLHLKNESLGSITNASTVLELEEIRIEYLGKKGKIAEMFKKVPHLEDEEKIAIGKLANEVKIILENAFEDSKQSLTKKAYEQDVKNEEIDVTAPSIKPQFGRIHPVTQVVWELKEAFEKLGYQIMEGGEIETEWYNFTALNIPPNHPARDLQDTFWIDDIILPRTHTSSMQVRTMEKLKPPFKVAVPGWVYRCEREDATHASQFWHFEGFVVGKNISFSDLKGTLTLLMRSVLGQNSQLKFRASYFPYVEPCAEMSASCPHCNMKGCTACGGSGWLEILGSGMIHPKVLENAGIDPKVYNGFAFCPGPTRLAMIKYKINDIRLLTGGDIRFLKQF